MDERFRQLARLLVRYSTSVKKGDLVLLHTSTVVPHDMNLAVIEAVMDAGGVLLHPVKTDVRLAMAARRGCTDRSLKVDATADLVRLLAADVNIVLRGNMNPFEGKGVPTDKSVLFEKIVNGHTFSERVDHSRWVLTIWPTEGFAQLLGRSTTEAEDFFFKAVLADYDAMARNVRPLVKLMEQTDKVRITGPGTDLSFSIKGIPVIPCVGTCNIPDGEVYTAPVRPSMNGVIQYNTPTITRAGDRFEGIRFEVKDGKIIKATCRTGDEAKLNSILDTDEGARYYGEFSNGINTAIDDVICDTLFDEKVSGTIHLTPGNSYDNAPNGNKSAVHWDLVYDQRPKAGGGNIYFDGKLIRKDGDFVPKALWGLNKKAA